VVGAVAVAGGLVVEGEDVVEDEDVEDDEPLWAVATPMPAMARAIPNPAITVARLALAVDGHRRPRPGSGSCCSCMFLPVALAGAVSGSSGHHQPQTWH
jgi:hypothetical protein